MPALKAAATIQVERRAPLSWLGKKCSFDHSQTLHPRYVCSAAIPPPGNSTMAFDKLKGTAQEAAGQVQSAAGEAFGDRGTQAKGKARQYGGQAQDAYGEAKSRASDAADYVSDSAGDLYEHGGDYAQRGARAVTSSAKEYPIVAILIAAGLGFVVAMLMQR